MPGTVQCYLCSKLVMELPTMIPNFNLATLHYPLPVQDSEVSLQRAAREAEAHPETRRRKQKKGRNQRRRNHKTKGRRNPKNHNNKDNKR